MEPAAAFFGNRGNWQARLAAILATMRELSSQTDPQEMVRAYAARIETLLPRDRLLALSRRDLHYPRFRITRDSAAAQPVNPWREPEALPLLSGGLLAQLLYSDEPHVIDHLEVADDDPARPYLGGQRSLMALPLFDRGVALNMVVVLQRRPAAFDPQQLPEHVWMSNLLGRATHHLVLADQLRQAYEEVDQELAAVAEIQRSLLPAALPRIPQLDLAAHYQTSRRAGGDYYDFFPLVDGKWGILIADVSGHGTAAAVVMAITHTLAHTYPAAPDPPGALLMRLNRQLTRHYTHGAGTFVTAFYGVFDPRSCTLTYASAGHNPPRLKRCADGTLVVLDGVGGMPLGILEAERYGEVTLQLQRGDQIVFYTDGITEAFNDRGEMFGPDRLDEILTNCSLTAAGLLAQVLRTVDAFVAGTALPDDRTLLIAKVN